MRNQLLLGGWGVPLRRLTGSPGASRRGHIGFQRNRLPQRPIMWGRGIAVMIPVIGGHRRRVELVRIVFEPFVAYRGAVYRRCGAWNHVASAGLRGNLRRRWRVCAIVVPQLELPFVHAARVSASPFYLAAALCFHVIVAEAQFVAQLPVRVGRLSYLDWIIRTAYLNRRIWAVSWR